MSCTACSGKLIFDESTGEHICSKCGLVVEETISQGSDTRDFTPDEAESRRHAEPGKLGTKLIHSSKMKPEQASNFHRMKWIGQVSNGTEERNMSVALPQISKLCADIKVGENVRALAIRFYKQAFGKDLVKGRRIVDFTTACVFAACKKLGAPREFKMLIKYTDSTTKLVFASYRLMVDNKIVGNKVIDPIKCIPGIATKFNLPVHIQEEAAKLIRESDGISGKTPYAVAAATLYLVTRDTRYHRVTQKDVALAANTTEVTIRNILRGVYKFWNNTHGRKSVRGYDS